MNTAIKFSVSVVALALISGCATAKHNVPNTQQPNKVEHNHAELFVDQDGSFYPDGWAGTYKISEKSLSQRKLWSLIKAANNEEKAGKLTETQDGVARQIEEKFKIKKRIFILVHGFSNSEKVANQAFEKI